LATEQGLLGVSASPAAALADAGQRRSRSVARAFVIPGVLLCVMLVLGLWGKVAPPFDPLATNPSQVFLRPGTAGHLLGTDQYGRDVFSRVLAATYTDLGVGLLITVIALTIGTTWGAIAGYAGGWVDHAVMRVVDVMVSFPAFLLALAITAVLGNSLRNVIIAITIAYTPYFIRLTRSELLSARTSDYAENARAVGNPGWRILTMHLLPNSLGPSVVQASLTAGWAILDVAGLSFLGLGIRPPTPEWGSDVGTNASFMVSGQWWPSVAPGIAILVTVLAFNLLGDAFRTLYGRRRGRL
jgi:peptide/nickel transport system permease protein